MRTLPLVAEQTPHDKFQHRKSSIPNFGTSDYSGQSVENRIPQLRNATAFWPCRNQQRKISASGDMQSAGDTRLPPGKFPPFFQNRDMSVPRPVTLFGLLLTAVCGCGPEAQVRQYVAKPDPGQEQKILTTELIRGRFQKGGGSATASVPFRWLVPQNWTAAAQDQFSQFAWTSGPGQSVRITVTGLPGSAGIEPQFVRWGGQINLDTSDPAALLKKVEELSLGGAQGQWIELKGPSDTILGMIVPHGEMLWVVKLKGENSAAAEVRASFRQFCESWQAG